MAGDRSENSNGVSRRLAALSYLLRVIAKPRVARLVGPADARRDFDRAARWLFRAPPYALWLDGNISVPEGRDLPVTRISCSQTVDRSKVILFLHGGAYVAGSPSTHRKMLARLSKLAGVPVLAPEYRLAPEHPFPAALEDARAAWDHLYAVGYDPEDIVIGGDSAGGGLALALLADLCAKGTPPAALFAFSPWTDLAGTGRSLTENAEADALLPAMRLAEVAQMYLHGHSALDPAASPLLAEFPSPPPICLQYAETEILRDDVLRMAGRLRAFGAEVRLESWPDAPHVWHLFDGWVPEARDALTRVAAFVREALRPVARPRDES